MSENGYRVAPAGPERSEWNCPRCDERLFVGHGSDMVLHGCGCCGGIFLSNEDSRRLCEAFPLGATELAERAEKWAREAVDQREPVNCPACREPMRRSLFDGAALELDVCATHGTWFDRGEMQRVARALHPPSPQKPAWTYDPTLARGPGSSAFDVFLSVAGAVLDAADRGSCCHDAHHHHRHHRHA